jgi:hypothetical protein
MSVVDTVVPQCCCLPGKTKNPFKFGARPLSGRGVNPFGGLARRDGMGTLAELLTRGEPGLLVLALVSFAMAALSGVLAARLRPRPCRRIAR